MNNNDVNVLKERTMELSDLNVFRTVVAAGGITRAAEQLHRVQSNVTTRVRQLEEELGVELFIRQGKKLSLSPAGRILLDYADRLLALAAEARDALQDSSPRGAFRLGSMESTASVRLPGVLSKYHCKYPTVALELRTGDTRHLATGVLLGELDAALVAEPVPDGPFDKLPIYKEELVLIAAANHPPIRSAADIRTRAILAFEPGCVYRRRLEDWFEDHELLPERLIELDSYHTMMGCAAAGMGVAMVPASVVETYPHPEALSVHPLPSGKNAVWTVLISRKGAMGPNLTAFIDILKEDSPPIGATPLPRRKPKAPTKLAA
jgi:DNA-binding transcriptional LysR family regulator